MNNEEMERIRVSLAAIDIETIETQKVLGTIKETLLERPDATCVISVGPLAPKKLLSQPRKSQKSFLSMEDYSTYGTEKRWNKCRLRKARSAS